MIGDIAVVGPESVISLELDAPSWTAAANVAASINASPRLNPGADPAKADDRPVAHAWSDREVRVKIPPAFEWKASLFVALLLDERFDPAAGPAAGAIVVEKGDKVSVVASGKGWIVKGTGISQENGAPGDQVIVMDTMTEKRYRAQIIDAGESDFKAERKKAEPPSQKVR